MVWNSKHSNTVQKSPRRIVPLSHTLSPPILRSKTENPHIRAREEREHQIDGFVPLSFTKIVLKCCIYRAGLG